MSSTLEVVPQRVYKIDGVPAFKSGEWPGIRSSRFPSSKLILKPIRNPKHIERGSKFKIK